MSYRDRQGQTGTPKGQTKTDRKEQKQIKAKSDRQ